MPAHLLWRGERRMEGESYLTEGYQVRLAIEGRAAGWKKLGQLANVTQPNRLKGIQVPEGEGIPFLAATQVFGIRPIPRKWLAMERTPGAQDRFVAEGTILVTCSGTVGRTITAPAALKGVLITHDLLRVNPNSPELSGWIYAFLHSPQAQAMMTSSHYGQMIKHLEPSHLEGIPVPVVSPSIARKFLKQSQKVLELRNLSHAKTLEAESLFENNVGTFTPKDDGEKGFSTKMSEISNGRLRFEASYYPPDVLSLISFLKQNPLGTSSIDQLGYKYWVPSRYKRRPAENGVRYCDSSDLLEFNPQPAKVFADCDFGDEHNGRIERKWILIPCSGQVYGIIGTPCMAGEQFEGCAISNHVMRVAPTELSLVRPGYLLTALSHPTLGRPLLKALPFGSSVPEISPSDLGRIPIVRLKADIENQIGDLAEAAAEARGEADELERRMAMDAGAFLTRYMDGDVADFVVTMPPVVNESPKQARPFGEHECVRLVASRKDAGLRKGALGAIVHIYQGGITFEVEFPDAKEGYEVLTLEASDLLPA